MTRTLTAEWQPAPAEVIQQEDKEEDWHNKALCAQVDSEIFFPEKAVQHVRRKRYVDVVLSKLPVWRMPLKTRSDLAYGAVCLSANVER